MRKVFWLLGAMGTVGLVMSVVTAQEQTPSLYRSARPTAQSGSGKAPAGLTSREAALAEAAARSGQIPQGASPDLDATSRVGILKYERTRPSSAARAAASADAQGDQPVLKNYERELFGPDASGARASAAKPAASTAATAPKTGRGPNGAPLPAANRGPFRDSAIQQAGAVQQAGGDIESISESGVEQAGGLMPAAKTAGGVRQADFSKRPNDAGAIRPVSGTQRAPLIPEKAGAGAAGKLPAIGREGAAALSLAPVAKPTAAASSNLITNFTKDAPKVRVEWKKLSDINVGQPGNIELIVKNEGDAPASDVEVSASFPHTIRLTKADPMPESAEGNVVWKLPKLDAGEERHIAVTLIPSQRGEITTNANVRYTTAATSTFKVEEPLLKVLVEAPKEVMIGEMAANIVTVSNPGTGTAQNVIIEVAIPDGLTHEKGSRLKMEIGALAPGESRSIRLPLTGKVGGDQVVKVDARSGTELSESSTAHMKVIAPSIHVEMKGPALRYVGRDARYTIAVTNDGQAADNNVRVIYTVPKGFEFQSASNGGKYDDVSRTVSWFVGTLNVRQSMELSLKLKPLSEGDFKHLARAITEHGAQSESTTATKIEGTASLVLEVADLEDPVETGRETAYEIRVRNEGSREAQNVGLSLELPAGMEFITAKGPSSHIAESGLVVFKSLPSLAPGKSAIFQIQVKGAEEGNQRVRARLTSESIQEPLTIEEITRFYAE